MSKLEIINNIIITRQIKNYGYPSSKWR